MGNSFKSYKDLEVWQKGMALVKDIYKVTADFPGEEKFGLVNQIRRSAVSIPSNIAEGHARSGTGEFKHFISIAMGSVAESETQLILSAELGYLNGDACTKLLNRLDIIGKMLRGLHKSLETHKNKRFMLVEGKQQLVSSLKSPVSSLKSLVSSLKPQVSRLP